MKKTHLIVHHSATSDGETFSWGAIRNFHIKDRGWRDVGYHIGTEKIGDSYWDVLGRNFDDHGAHCPDGAMNVHGIGWCIVGNFDVVAPSPDLLAHCVKTAAHLCRLFKIPPDNILGHREAQGRWGHVTKTCPGTRFNMPNFRMAVAAVL